MVTNCDHLIRLKFSPVLPLAFTENRLPANWQDMAVLPKHPAAKQLDS